MRISSEAVEAAAKALAGSPLKLEAAGWTFDYVALAQTALEAAAPYMLARDASADVAAAFANAESAKRALVARAIGVDPEVARSLGYGTAK